MGKQKYNYDAALQLLVNSYTDGHKVTYKELQEALGLEKPIEDKAAASTNRSILSDLRNRFREEYNLTFKSAANGIHSGPEYHYYVISEIKESPSKKILEPTEIRKDVNLNALSKDNQRLYVESEKLKLEVERLQIENAKLKEREIEYRKIINSFYVLSMT